MHIRILTSTCMLTRTTASQVLTRVPRVKIAGQDKQEKRCMSSSSTPGSPRALLDFTTLGSQEKSNSSPPKKRPRAQMETTTTRLELAWPGQDPNNERGPEVFPGCPHPRPHSLTCRVSRQESKEQTETQPKHLQLRYWRRGLKLGFLRSPASSCRRHPPEVLHTNPLLGFVLVITVKKPSRQMGKWEKMKK
jgi:hypothetical protein